MLVAPSLVVLWCLVPAPHALFDVARIAFLLLGAWCFLLFVFVLGSLFVFVKSLSMHGEIKQRGRNT